MRMSVLIEGAHGLTWPRWKEYVAAVERMGFYALYSSDHYALAPAPPDRDSLELIVALTYLADRSERVHFGSLVSPLSFRDPVLLARQALALDDLSGGRIVLGVGAGWNEREHAMFGYDLGDLRTRMDRLEEGLAVISLLLHGDEPVTYAGRFFQLREAILLPRPRRPGGPPLMIGGTGPRRTLPLVARYADIWNASRLTPDEMRERSARLDELLRAEGRQPGDVRRTRMSAVICGRDAAEREARVRGRRAQPQFATMPLDAMLDTMRERSGAIIGTPEQVIAQIRAYAAVGVDELMVQWFPDDDIAGLQMLAETVMPHVTE